MNTTFFNFTYFIKDTNDEIAIKVKQGSFGWTKNEYCLRK